MSSGIKYLNIFLQNKVAEQVILVIILVLNLVFALPFFIKKSAIKKN